MTYRAKLAGALLALLIASSAPAQPNPFQVDSTWPSFHRSPEAQASGELDGPQSGELLDIAFIENAPGGTSPWTVLFATYSDGSQAAIGSTRKGVVKHLVKEDRFEQVAFTRLKRRQLDFDWNVMVLRGNRVLTTSRRRNSFYVLRDSAPDCPTCPLEVEREIRIPERYGDMTQQFQLAFDGTIMLLMEDNSMLAVSPATGRALDRLELGLADRDYSHHNAFPMDSSGRLILASQKTVTAVDWDGFKLRQAWQSPYDFRGPGCGTARRGTRFREIRAVVKGKTCTGTGTTPTLLGDARAGLVVMVDGHAPRNRLVAFWRGEIPPDWRGIPDYDRRVAGILPLPHSTPLGDGFTAENSPAVLGNSVFIAQWAGFSPKCDAPRGVQRVDWNDRTRQFELVWANPDVHFNGIPTASSRTGLVYGSGVGEDCTVRYRGLDVDTGEVRLDAVVDARADESGRIDQGNQHTLAADGSVLFAAKKGLLRVRGN